MLFFMSLFLFLLSFLSFCRSFFVFGGDSIAQNTGIYSVVVALMRDGDAWLMTVMPDAGDDDDNDTGMHLTMRQSC